MITKQIVFAAVVAVVLGGGLVVAIVGAVKDQAPAKFHHKTWVSHKADW